MGDVFGLIYGREVDRWIDGSMDWRTYRWAGGPADELTRGQSGVVGLADISVGGRMS